jgi:hypothetical protein
MQIKQDKIKHFFVGAFASAVALTISFNPLFGILAAFLLGLAKEVWDYFHPEMHTADIWDLVATTLGGISWTAIFTILLV